MAVLVQQKAPTFTAEAVMEDGSFKQLKLDDYRGKYVLLFFYPLDFTFVCPTEIISFSDRGAEFQKLGVQILGVSVDSAFSHLAWRNTPRNVGGLGDISYPLIADLKKDIARAYDVLLPDLASRLQSYLAHTDELLDAPSVEIIRRMLADIERMQGDRRAVGELRPDVMSGSAAWIAGVAQSLASCTDLVDYREDVAS